MALSIRLEQSKFNDERNGQRWHARTVSTGEVSTAELAANIQSNSTFKEGEVKGLITELVDQMARQMREGKTVVIDGLGRFRLSVESASVEQAADFQIGKHIKAIRCKFIPAGKNNPDTHTKIDHMAQGASIEWHKGKRSEEIKNKQ